MSCAGLFSVTTLLLAGLFRAKGNIDKFKNMSNWKCNSAAPGIPEVKEDIISISYTWPQEPNGFERYFYIKGEILIVRWIASRTAKLKIPHGGSGEKFPVVFHLHG